MFRKLTVMILVCYVMILGASFADVVGDYHTSMYYGGKMSIHELLTDVGIEEKTLSIETTNRLVADVKGNAVVGMGIGMADLVCQNGRATYVIHIEVKSPIKEIIISEDEVTLLHGEKAPIPFELHFYDAYKGSTLELIEWTSKNPRIVSINDKEELVTHAVGKVKILGVSKDGTQNIAFDVDVEKIDDMVEIQREKNTLRLDFGQTYALEALMGNKDVTKSVDWIVSDKRIISIDENGVITPKNIGQATVTAKTTLGNNYDELQVYVDSMIESILIDQTQLTFDALGAKKQFLTTVIPANDDQPVVGAIKYASSNDEIVKIDQKGLMTTTGYGIALVTAYSLDGAHADHCTVEVINRSKATSLEYTPLKSIDMFTYYTDVIIGEKVPIEITLDPVVPTNSEVHFSVSKGHSNQITNIDGSYYFIPNQLGKITVKVMGSEYKTDSLTFNVVSPILDVALSAKGNNKEVILYPSEQVALEVDLSAKLPYNSSQIYPNTLEYQVTDPDVVSLQHINGRVTLVALKTGTTEIWVRDITGKKEDKLKVRVKTLTRSLLSDKLATVPVGYTYSPRIYDNTNSDAMISLKNTGLASEVKDIYLDSQFISTELKYERTILERLTKTEGTVDSNVILKHKNRMALLMRLSSLEDDGYVNVTGYIIRDRKFAPIKLYDQIGNFYSSDYPIKLNIEVQVAGVARKTNTLIEWKSDSDTIIIKDRRNKYLSVDELLNLYGLQELYISSDDEKLIALVNYINYFEHIGLEEKYKDEAFKALLKEELSLIPTYMLENYDAIATRGDLARLLFALNEDVSSYDRYRSIYYDAVSTEMIDSIGKGYLIPSDEDYIKEELPLTSDYINQVMNGQYKFKEDGKISRLELLKRIMPLL